MMKKLLILIALLILVFTGNWVYGNILSKKIEDRILLLSKSVNDRLVVKFDHVKVNPLLSKLQLKGLQVTTVEGQELAQGEKVVLDMPYNEAIRLLNGKKVDELKALKLKVDNLRVGIDEAGGELLLGHLFIDFNGAINKADIQTIQTAFPSVNQRLRVQAKDVTLGQTPWLHALGFNPEQIKDVNQFNELSIECELQPLQSQLKLVKFNLDADWLDCQSSGVLNYVGEGLTNAKAKKAESSFNLKLKQNGMTWGDATTNGKFSLDKLSIKSDAVVDYSGSTPSVQSQSSHILLENLSVEYAGTKRAQLEAQTALLGLKMDKITVGKLAINSVLANDWLTITDSELQSSFMDIDLNAKVNVSSEAPGASQIESATLIVSNLAPGIQNGLSTFELMTMQSLPRNGDAIILEMTGPVSRPVIKGLRY
ncbi:hypothetical protein KEM09_13095 [Carboxylicivirga mesophila]|uniref:AsmA domain-containing protein n=1 Tax=Carboxylicivirga mesophila TaxID=1166478 RepID=A0ABS5KBE9_9BACT|nr:hypothetical protein [Carboxylicivirga mesophila]MBS2212345.1 hypothetical protein [Carboxylicivirga mesophila]